MAKQIKPTEGELEILQILWEKGKATVREVHEIILQTKEAGYTTTLKLMQIMFEKGLVLRNDSAKTHVYEANVSKEKTQSMFVDRIVNSLFGGNSTQMVMQVLGSQSPSKQEIDEIQQLLDNLKNQ